MALCPCSASKIATCQSLEGSIFGQIANNFNRISMGQKYHPKMDSCLIW